MATSGSISLSATRDDIITEALELAGVNFIGKTPSAAQLTTCTRSMNYMLKSWQAKGLNMFALQRTYLFLTKDTNEYLLGSTANFSTDFNKTTLDGDHGSTATSLILASSTNVTTGTKFVVELSDGTNTVVTASGPAVSNVVPITGTLGGAATGSATVYYYNTDANRPMKLIEVVRRDSLDRDIPVKILALEEYTRLSDKKSDGVPIQVYPRAERTLMRLRVWPEPTLITDYLVMWVQRTLDDVDVATDEVDYPQEWFDAIALGLAYRVSKKFGVPAQKRAELKADFNEAFFDVYGYDSDNDGAQFIVDFRGESN